MIETTAAPAMTALVELHEIRSEIEEEQRKTDIQANPSEDIMRTMEYALEKVEQAARPLGLEATLRKTSYLQTFYSFGSPQRNLAQLLIDLEHLGEAFTSEAGTIKFLCLPSERLKYYVGDDAKATPFGQAVHDAFPSAALDSREASNCYALGRWPATVFHLMRVLEFGLAVLAERFGVSPERSTWHEVIEAIEGKIRKIKPETEGSNWKQEQKQFSDAATQFMFFKDAWRNHIMHVRDVYDEGRATSIWQHTNEFMNKLAAIGLKERP